MYLKGLKAGDKLYNFFKRRWETVTSVTLDFFVTDKEEEDSYEIEGNPYMLWDKVETLDLNNLPKKPRKALKSEYSFWKFRDHKINKDRIYFDPSEKEFFQLPEGKAARKITSLSVEEVEDLYGVKLEYLRNEMQNKN